MSKVYFSSAHECVEVHCSNQGFHCVSVQSALEAKVTAATVKWVGEGSWTPDNLCFDWDHEAYQVWTCTVLYCTVLYCTVPGVDLRQHRGRHPRHRGVATADL